MEKQIIQSRPCLCGTMRRASRLVTHAYDLFLQPVGLKVTQFSMLRAIQNQGPTSVTELSDKLLLERTSCTRNLQLLEKMGTVTIETGSDKRVRLVSLSEYGGTLLQQAMPLWEQAQDHFYNRFEPERVSCLIDELLEITKKLSE